MRDGHGSLGKGVEPDQRCNRARQQKRDGDRLPPPGRAGGDCGCISACPSVLMMVMRSLRSIAVVWRQTCQANLALV